MFVVLLFVYHICAGTHDWAVLTSRCQRPRHSVVTSILMSDFTRGKKTVREEPRLKIAQAPSKRRRSQVNKKECKLLAQEIRRRNQWQARVEMKQGEYSENLFGEINQRFFRVVDPGNFRTWIYMAPGHHRWTDGQSRVDVRAIQTYQLTNWATAMWKWKWKVDHENDAGWGTRLRVCI